MKSKKIFSRVLPMCIGAIILLFVIFPLFWVVSTSFKSRTETFALPPYFVPKTPVLSNYTSLWETHSFGVYYLNSIIVAVITTIVCLALANLAAFGFSRYRMKFGNSLLMFILLSQMVPGVLFVIPYFLMMSKMGLINTRLALIIAHISFALPFTTWMLQGYYDSIPKSIDEAAKIDGCSRFQVLAKVVFPLSIPGNMATLIFAFMQSWNEYLFSMSLATTQSKYTIPVGIAMFIGEYKTAWNEIMAASVVASVPVILVFLLVDKYMIGGLTAGSVRQ